jgi:hypothetical protein
VALLHRPRAWHEQMQRHECPSSCLARSQRVELDTVFAMRVEDRLDLSLLGGSERVVRSPG